MAKPAPMQTRGPPPNGKKGVAGPLRAGFGRPAIEVEGLGLGPPPLVAVAHPGREEENAALADRERAELELLDGAAAEQPDGRVEPKRLVDDLADEVELLEVGGRGRLVSDDAIELGVRGLLRLGVEGEQQAGPGQRRRGRLVPGEEERHDLVAHELVRQVLGPVGLGLEQQCEEVVRRIDQAPPFLDDLVDRGPEEADVRVVAPEPGEGQAAPEPGEWERQPARPAERLAERPVQLGGAVPDLG